MAKMTIREHGKSLEKKVVRGSETVGRDVKEGMVRLRHGARSAGRDVESAGKKIGRATRRGLTRADDRLRPNHRAKASNP
jgi:predicted small secreted protein